MEFDSDHVDSDDMEAILEYTAREAAQAAPSQRKATSSKQDILEGNTVNDAIPAYTKQQELNKRLSALNTELGEIEQQITDLQDSRETILAEQRSIMNELETQNRPRPSFKPTQVVGIGKSMAPGVHGAIDYMTETFDWQDAMDAHMKEVFNIPSFRHCQRGVCNANMDGRDIVCVMPTGGGKSLTYQLPALLNPGLTVVISPLISLITDQVMHLQEFGIEAVMLKGSITKEETSDIYSRLFATANGRSKLNPDGTEMREIKLCYVTPEKIVKSTAFINLMEKLANAGKLARIVIDEAHCVSQLGHDFRPDYKRLSLLRQLLPLIPILALSATCPPDVLKDLLSILGMPKSVTTGTAAEPNKTVYFTAPLYRKNLHYKVLQKPSSSSEFLKVMTDYILTNHKDDFGIVYCFSKKDCESLAQGLYRESKGKILTGVYHASVPEREKDSLHKRWRDGHVKVVCATIAFGLGIDKGDVRFVLHHSMSKSLEGYYQESGRAGRDGNDSDCILYFRSQDIFKVAGLVYAEHGASKKLEDMSRFCIDIEECRKVQFARYFSQSKGVSLTNWATADEDAQNRCGHCDNCLRAPEDLLPRDLTVEAWKIIHVSQCVEKDKGRVTLPQLADLVRGLGNGTFGISTGGRKGKGRKKADGEVDIDNLVSGKIDLGRDETESLILHLIFAHYLKLSFHTTSYSVNTYIVPSPTAIRLSRHKLDVLLGGGGQRFMVTLTKTASSKKASSRKTKDIGGTVSKEASSGKKRKRGTAQLVDDVDEDDEDIVDDDGPGMSLYADDELEADAEDVRPDKTRRRSNAGRRSGKHADRHASYAEDEDWSFTMSDAPATSSSSKGKGKGKTSIPPFQNFSFDLSASKQKTLVRGSTLADRSRCAPGVESTPKATTFAPASGSSRPILTSSLVRTKSTNRSVNDTPSELRRSAFTPSTAGRAREPFTNGKSSSSTPIWNGHANHNLNQFPAKAHHDVIEINSDSDF